MDAFPFDIQIPVIILARERFLNQGSRLAVFWAEVL